MSGKSHGLDVQNAAAQAGKETNEHSSSEPSGKDQPFDAARQGGTGGEVKGNKEGKGPFNDQVGGQDGEGVGVKMGKKETSEGGSMASSVKNMAQNLLGKKSFHTSARAFNSPIPSSPSSSASRKPKETDLPSESDQNPHLKHKDASTPDKGKGNASSDPHLPSHNKTASTNSSSPSSKRSLHTSSVRLTDPVPKKEDYPAQRDPVEEHEPVSSGAVSGKSTPSNQGGRDKPRTDKPFTGEGMDEAGTGTAQPPPSGGGAASKVSERGMGKRSFSTTPLNRLSDPVPKKEAYPAQRDPVEEHEPVSSGEVSGKSTPSNQGGRDRPRTDKPFTGEGMDEAGTGTAQPPPKGGGAASKVSERGMGKREYSTGPPPTARAQSGEPRRSGYNAPQEALPPNLKSSYVENDPNAINSDTQGLQPSSESHSSTAVDPPNETLRKQAKEGTLGERNMPPEAEIGRIGLEEAWKHRK